MAGVYKRESDKKRGKAGKWTAWYKNKDGKQVNRVAFTDKARSLEWARKMEADARGEREGLIDPKDRDRREHAGRPVAEHIDAYAASLAAKGDTAKHVGEVRRMLAELFDDASIPKLADMDIARIEQALARLRESRSARTTNKALGFLKAFVVWLYEADRISEVPRGLRSLKRANEGADQHVRRRAITRYQLSHLLTMTMLGDPVVCRAGTRHGPRPKEYITGPERACLYRLAMGTGFRAEEIRTLTPERFRLDGDEPTVTVLACYAKNGKEAVQPITRELADQIRPFVSGKPPGVPFLVVPRRTAAMLRRDLIAAGIEPETADGVLDFHALRASYITHLVEDGVNVKAVQELARHSTPTLTLGRYTKLKAQDLRAALDGRKTG